MNLRFLIVFEIESDATLNYKMVCYTVCVHECIMLYNGVIVIDMSLMSFSQNN